MEENPTEQVDDNSNEEIVDTLTPIELPSGLTPPSSPGNLTLDEEGENDGKEKDGSESSDDESNSDDDEEDVEKWKAEMAEKKREMEEQEERESKGKKTPRMRKPYSARLASRGRNEANFKKLSEKLKREVLRLQSACQELETEKTDLEKQIIQKEKLIRKTTNGIDKMLRTLKKFTKDVEVLERDVSDLRQENQTLAEMHSINLMTKERLDKLNQQRGGKRKIRPMNIDRKAKLVALEDEIKLKDRELREQEEEIKLLDDQIQRNEKSIDSIEGSIKKMHETVEESYHVEARNTELEYQIQSLEKEIRTLQQINRMKSHTVTQLNIQLENWESLEEAYLDVKKQVGTQDREVKRLLFELKQIEKEKDSREAELQRFREDRDTIPVECLRDDQDFLKKQIEASQRKGVEFEEKKKVEEKNLSDLQERLKLLEKAMKETGMNRKIARNKKKKHEQQLLLNASMMEEKQKKRDEEERMRRIEAANDRFGDVLVDEEEDEGEIGDDEEEEDEDEEEEETFDPEEYIQECLYELLEKEREIMERKRMEQVTLLVEKDSSISLLKDSISDMERENVTSDKELEKKSRTMNKKESWLLEEMKQDEERFVREERELRLQLVGLRRKAAGNQDMKRRRRRKR